MVTSSNQPFHFPHIQFYKQTHFTSEGRTFTLIYFEGMSSMTKIRAPPPFLFLSLQNGLANPSIENLPLGKEESVFVSVNIKTSLLFLIVYLGC